MWMGKTALMLTFLELLYNKLYFVKLLYNTVTSSTSDPICSEPIGNSTKTTPTTWGGMYAAKPIHPITL